MSHLPGVPADVVTLADYEAHARARLDANAWAYLSGGAADEITLRANRDAFDRLRLRSRVLADMTGAHTRLTLLGQPLDYPILLAPAAYQKLFHPDGELATVEAAATMRTPMVVSTKASVPLEDIAAASAKTVPDGRSAPLWFQLYLQPDRGFIRALVERVEAAGYRALVLTVDLPINVGRDRERRTRFHLPPGIDAANLRGMPPHETPAPGFLESQVFSGFLDTAPTWKDVAWLRGMTRLPLLLKGITAPEDAARGLDEGVDGLLISNHGGRALDTLPASIEALPHVADRVAGRVPLLLDGGVRRGTDVLKALALGADAVLIGRPYLHALAVAGAVGVAHVLHILRTELEVAMTLTGCPTLDRIDRSVLWDHQGA
jgi:4-hydroxymandelate oxidase